jgi:hypothetical protein
MNQAQQHLHSHAGTSFTKAVQQRCAQMRLVVSIWSKKTTGAGFSA